MERYVKRIRRSVSSSSDVYSGTELVETKTLEHVKLNFSDIATDPGLRRPIDEFDVNIRDEVRREYLFRGPCQLIGHVYPKRAFGNHERSFQEVWYRKYPWLEYSVSKDAAFCFWCYLFKQSDKGGRYAVDVFTKVGFSNWKRALEKFNSHVGAANSSHYSARIQFESFKDQSHSLAIVQSFSQEITDVYSARLTALLNVTRFLLKQGLPYFGPNQPTSSYDGGNFVELLEWYCEQNPHISEVPSTNALECNQMTTLEIQKQFSHICASEVALAIVNDIGDRSFTLLVEEPRHISMKEQMGVVLRYVNKDGCIIERFLAMVPVVDTSSHFLKSAIDSLFAEHDISLSKLRGQGYNGASSMRNEFNELKSLILRENPHAIYGHCFSYQLQSIVIAIGKEVWAVRELFGSVTMIVNTTGASCKMSDQLKQSEHERLVNALDGEEERENKDTRWGSHYLALLRVCSLWSTVQQVLENIRDHATSPENKCIAKGLIREMDNYEFVFSMHLMKYILEITNELSDVLLQNEKNIVQSLSLIRSVKYQMQSFREDGWKIILNQVNKFCELNHVPLIDMEDKVTRPGYKRQIITNFQYYHFEIFCQVVDLIIQELNDRFSEANIELLSCIACLDPTNSFSQFNVDKLMHFAALYTAGFSSNDYLFLPQQLTNFIANIRCDPQFSEISNLEGLAREMIETGKSSVFPLVYRLIELALVLPIATASIERAYSAMNIITTGLCNQLGDEWTNDSLVVYIEKDIFSTIGNKLILERFESTKHN